MTSCFYDRPWLGYRRCDGGERTHRAVAKSGESGNVMNVLNASMSGIMNVAGDRLDRIRSWLLIPPAMLWATSHTFRDHRDRQRMPVCGKVMNRGCLPDNMTDAKGSSMSRMYIGIQAVGPILVTRPPPTIITARAI